jgi:hypothetical protein
MGIEQGEEVKAKGIENIFNKIIAEKLPNIEKSTSRVRRVLGLQTGNTRTDYPHIIL